MLCNTHLYLDLVFLKILSCQIKCILLFWYIHKNTKGKLFTWLLRQYIRKKVVVVRFGYLMLTQIKQACFLLECIGLVKSELRQAMYTNTYYMYLGIHCSIFMFVWVFYKAYLKTDMVHLSWFLRMCIYLSYFCLAMNIRLWYSLGR